MIVKTLELRGAELVDGDAPIGYPAPLWLQINEGGILRVIGHATVNPLSGSWDVRVDAWRYGVAPTTPSRHLYSLCQAGDRNAAAFALISAAATLTHTR